MFISKPFVYINLSEDRVQCVFCAGIIGQWEDEDFPMTEHRDLYPECPFVRGFDVGNIPIHNSESSLLRVPGASFDTTPSPSRIDNPEYLMESMGIDEVGIRPHRHAFSGPEKGRLLFFFKEKNFSFSFFIHGYGGFRHLFCFLKFRAFLSLSENNFFQAALLKKIGN